MKPKMTHGSLFAGVDGFGRAFRNAGFETAFRVEWDEAAASVLAYHYPNDPLFCDVSKFYPNPNEYRISVLDGGSPCQDLSVAGQRAGLDGSRSGLFRQMVRIAKRLKPRFIVWENVPGAFSSNEGRDFAAIIEAFTAIKVEVPAEGWGNAGFVRTPFPTLRWNVAWRVLDTQYCGAPQRRRRIFLVASLGDASCAEVLFEPESLRGGNPPCRSERQDVAPTISARTKGGGGFGSDPSETFLPVCMSTGQSGAEIGIGIGTTLNCNHEVPIVAHTLRAEGENRPSRPSNVIAFAQNQVGELRTGDVVGTLGTNANASGRATPMVAASWGVRRLTPVECERLQSWEDGFTQYRRSVKLVGNQWIVGEKVKEQADGPRYKQCGNGVTTVVAEWIAKRIAQVLQSERTEPVE